MKISDFLSKKSIIINLEAEDKQSVIKEMVLLMVKNKEIKDADEIIKVLMDREKLGSTGIGEGIAIPHGKSSVIKKICLVFGRSSTGVNFEALDGGPVYLFFLLVAPREDAENLHLKILAKLSRLLKDSHFRNLLKQAKDDSEILSIIKLGEEDR
ncbi:MAG: PTS sugar transporter subunit IIA [Candidatus Firestonebacteria bacterium]|nr:PTS sugar transporter subunit IIA [Candidatus Firestonebacteria bacterium]